MKLKNKLIILLMTVMLLNIFLVSAADYPTITPFVNDFANILTPGEEGQLQAQLKLIEEQTGYEVVVLTVETTNGEDRTMFANKVGEENGVGKKDESNGLIVMWSLDNEKGGAIATGRGAESIFNDAKVGRMGRDSRPLFDDEKYYEGFVKIVNDINQELNVTGEPHEEPEVELTPGMIVGLLIFIAIMVVLYIIFPDFFLFALIFHMLMPSRGGNGGFSFGGSSGGFGGAGSRF